MSIKCLERVILPAPKNITLQILWSAPFLGAPVSDPARIQPTWNTGKQFSLGEARGSQGPNERRRTSPLL